MNETGTNPEEVAAAAEAEVQQTEAELEETAAEAAAGAEDEVVVVDEETQDVAEQPADQAAEDAGEKEGTQQENVSGNETSVAQDIEALVMDPVFASLLESESEAERAAAEARIRAELDEEQARRLDKINQRFAQIEAAAGITYEVFSEINAGNSMEVFLRFLTSPLDTTGRDGQPLRFGQEGLGDLGQAEKVPKQVTRELLKNAASVGKHFSEIVDKVNADWVATNSELIQRYENSEDPAILKELFLKMIQDLLINHSNSQEHIKFFRAYFPTVLTNSNELKYLDDESFNFLLDQFGEDSSIDELWQIASDQDN